MLEQRTRVASGLEPILLGGLEDQRPLRLRDLAVGPGDLDQGDHRDGQPGLGAQSRVEQLVEHGVLVVIHQYNRRSDPYQQPHDHRTHPYLPGTVTTLTM